MSLKQKMQKKLSQSDIVMGEKEKSPIIIHTNSRFLSLSKEDTNWDEIAEVRELNNPDRIPSTTFDVDEAQKLANEMAHALRPLELFMKILFRFPLVRRVYLAGGHYSFTFVPTSISAIGFYITGVLMFLNLFLMIINLFSTVLNYPEHRTFKGAGPDQLRAYELYILHRNAIPIGMIFAALSQSCFGLLNFCVHRDFAAKAISFWTQSAGILNINLSHGIRKYMIFVLTTFGVIWILLIALTIAQFIPVGNGAPAIFAQLSFRVFNPNLFFVGRFSIVREIYTVWLIYIFICSKVDILLFVFQCKLLVNAFHAWNTRADRVLHRGAWASKKKEKMIQRTGFHTLYHDHVVLLDMIEGSDIIFGHTVLVYYITTMGSICFEVYYFFRSQLTKSEFFGARQMDGIYVFLYLSQQLFVLFIVSKSAGAVSQTAMEALEILRRKGYMGERRKDDELYFMMSMFMSFTGHFETAVTASYFFLINNSTMITVLGILFTYFVILTQLAPQLAYFPKGANHSHYLSERNIRIILDHFESSWNILPAKSLSPSSNATSAMNATMSMFSNSTTMPMFSNSTNMTIG